MGRTCITSRARALQDVQQLLARLRAEPDGLVAVDTDVGKTVAKATVIAWRLAVDERFERLERVLECLLDALAVERRLRRLTPLITQGPAMLSPMNANSDVLSL